MQTTLFVASFFGMFGGLLVFLYQLVRLAVDLVRRRGIARRATWLGTSFAATIASGVVYRYNAPYF